jgi:dephospho-CoA kinase
MIKVGLTGGIGSGKTTVANVFKVLGVPVYFADEAAKLLMNSDEALKTQIKAQFTKSAYLPDGTLNRAWMAEQVFSDKEKLDSLNALVHPATIKDADNWMRRQQTPYAIKEAALIFESGSQGELDYIIGVYAPAPVRIVRAMKRNGSSREEVQARMDKQLQESVKMRLCDFVITNDDRQAIVPQVMKIHAFLLEKAAAVASGG